MLGVSIDPLTMDELVGLCEKTIASGDHMTVGVVNAAKIVNMRKDDLLRDSVQQSDVVVADGISVIWASRLLGHPLPERVAGIDLFIRLLAQAAATGRSVYLLGATDEVLEKMLVKIKQDHPLLNIAGTRNGYFGTHEEEQVAREIRASGADYLFVGMSSPKKERFIGRWKDELGVRICHGVGGSFDVLAGKVKRAPLAWQRLGMEWLYRLLQEPRRLGMRYLVTNFLFVGMALREAVGRLRPGRGYDPKVKAQAEPRQFDGFLFVGGGDWWYHNRGHYCMQMTRHLSRHVKTLYVNSIGVRIPKLSEGRMFFVRVLRKLSSWRRGMRRVDENLCVLSPIAVPGTLGMRLSRGILGWQVRRQLRRIGIHNPLIWVVCPPGAELLDQIQHAGVIYQRTDRWEDFPGCDPEEIRRYDKLLKQRADVVLYCSTHLFHSEAESSGRAHYVDHGVDFETFVAADREGAEPDDVRDIPRPRIGFIGGIDSHTFDAALFRKVAEQLNDVSFVLVGACSIDPELVLRPNVHMLGRKPYEQVPSYMAACDVLIMPWNDNEWIRCCNPVKLKEYMATGRPIVSTPFPELKAYEGFVHVARDAEEFSRGILGGIERDVDVQRMRNRVQAESWSARAQRVLELIAQAGMVQRR